MKSSTLLINSLSEQQPSKQDFFIKKNIQGKGIFSDIVITCTLGYVLKNMRYFVFNNLCNSKQSYYICIIVAFYPGT